MICPVCGTSAGYAPIIVVVVDVDEVEVLDVDVVVVDVVEVVEVDVVVVDVVEVVDVPGMLVLVVVVEMSEVSTCPARTGQTLLTGSVLVSVVLLPS